MNEKVKMMDFDRLAKNREVIEAIKNAEKSPLLQTLHRFLMGSIEDLEDLEDLEELEELEDLEENQQRPQQRPQERPQERIQSDNDGEVDNG